MPEEDQGRWQKFVAEPLAEMNDKNSRELGGHNPMHFSSDDDGDSDYRDIPFSTGSAQQVGVQSALVIFLCLVEFYLRNRPVVCYVLVKIILRKI